MSDAGVSFLLEAVAEDVRRTFTPAQIAELKRAAASRMKRHALEYRVSLPTPWGKAYYLSVRGGEEQRNEARLESEGQREATKVAFAYAGMLTLVGSVALLAVFLAVAAVRLIAGGEAFSAAVTAPLPLTLILK
jgi:hypothetical protein